MKQLRIGVIFFVSMMVVTGLATSCFATADCSSAQVMMIGTNPGAGGVGSSGIKVSLKNLSGHTVGTDWLINTNRMFFLTTDLGDQGLATLLTAMSLNKPVWVRIAGNAEPASLISIIYLSN